HELQLFPFALAEELLAAAYKERMDPKLELIEQAMLEQGVRQQTMAIDDEVLAVLSLERGRLARDIARDERGVRPIGLLQGRREDVLAHLIDPIAIGALSMRKRGREELVGPPPHQHRVAGQEQLQRLSFGLLVEVVRRPNVRFSDDAVD